MMIKSYPRLVEHWARCLMYRGSVALQDVHGVVATVKTKLSTQFAHLWLTGFQACEQLFPGFADFSGTLTASTFLLNHWAASPV